LSAYEAEIQGKQWGETGYIINQSDMFAELKLIMSFIL